MWALETFAKNSTLGLEHYYALKKSEQNKYGLNFNKCYYPVCFVLHYSVLLNLKKNIKPFVQ